MGAPVATPRTPPSGIWVPDGFRTKITFSDNPGLAIFETSVKPSGVEGIGDPIEQNSMWNTRWGIMRERQLIKQTPAVVKFMYDPAFKNALNGLTHHNQTITETLYDGSTVAYFGFPHAWEFDEHTEGNKGTGQVTIQPSNWDPVGRVEAAPVFVPVAGS